MRPIMRPKLLPIFIFSIVIFVCISCSRVSERGTPDFYSGDGILQFNTALRMSISREFNESKIGIPISLVIVNNSDQLLEVKIDEIQIFRNENSHWEPVGNKAKNVWVNFFDSEAKDVPVTSITLQPKNVFPGDSSMFDVLPDLTSEKPVTIRIYVFAHVVNGSGSQSQNILGSFVDVTLVP